VSIVNNWGARRILKSLRGISRTRLRKAMARFDPDPTTFSSLKGKVVVVSGGANGIGASLVSHLHALGCSVVFGDLPQATHSAQTLISSLNKSNPDDKSTVRTIFVPLDVTSYTSIYNLFHAAHTALGSISYVISCAGILERGSFFDPALTIESVGMQEPGMEVLDVNLRGSAWFARIAAVFLREGGE